MDFIFFGVLVCAKALSRCCYSDFLCCDVYTPPVCGCGIDKAVVLRPAVLCEKSL
jgi:hypothetical protein